MNIGLFVSNSIYCFFCLFLAGGVIEMYGPNSLYIKKRKQESFISWPNLLGEYYLFFLLFR